MKDMIVSRGKKAHEVRTKQAEDAVQRVEPRLKPIEGLVEKPQAVVDQEVQKFVAQHAAVASPEVKSDLEDRLAKYSVLIEYEDLPGAPFYRTKVVGRSIVIILNTHHRFYEPLATDVLRSESPHRQDRNRSVVDGFRCGAKRGWRQRKHASGTTISGTNGVST